MIVRDGKERDAWYHGEKKIVAAYHGDRLVWKEDTGGIPSAYQQVPYLQSDGNQWINTGLVWDGYIECWFTVVLLPTTDCYLMGARTNDGQICPYGWYGGSSMAWQYAFDTYKTLAVRPNAITNELHIIIENGRQLFEGNVTANRTDRTSKPLAQIPMYLFARNNGGTTVDQKAKCIMYSCTIKTNAGMVRDFVPVYRLSDGKTGMWCNVTKQFFPNIGSREFIIER